jgi:hypothetical protein
MMRVTPSGQGSMFADQIHTTFAGSHSFTDDDGGSKQAFDFRFAS